MSENTAKTDGIDPPALPLNPEIYNGDFSIGEPTNNSLLSNLKFACWDGKKYIARHPNKGAILSRKERLWLFLTIRTEISKSRLLELQFVKHSSL